MKHITTTLFAIVGLPLCVQQAGALPVDVPLYQDIDVFRQVNVNGNLALGVTLNAAHLSEGGIFDIQARPSDGSPSVTILGGPNPPNDINNRYLNWGTTYDDITGFEPEGPWRITSAYAYFYLRGANNANDVYSFDLTGFLQDSVEGQGNFSRLTLGGSLGDVGLTFLNNNGYMEYTVSIDPIRIDSNGNPVYGQFTLDYAQLQVLTVEPNDPGPSGVPDAGSTAGLMGCALLALGTVARRLKVQ